MRRTLAALVVVGLGAGAAISGPYMSAYYNKQNEPVDGISWGPRYQRDVPNVQGPYGQPVPMTAYSEYNPLSGADVAKAQIQRALPAELAQQVGATGGLGGGLLPMAGMAGPGMPPMPGMTPPGMPALPAMPGAPAPPMGPPAPKPPAPGNYPIPPGAVNAMGAIITPPTTPFPVSRTEVKFVGPAGMKISWFAPSADGRPGFSTQYLEAPGRYNFLQASFYRLKLYDIPNRPGVTLYPTLEVVPCKAKTAAFLAHSAVPIAFTEDDFEQVAAGNYVVKVIYLPDPQFQDLAATAPDEVVSSRLEPGMDPIVEAQRRGCILLVVRLGNIDLEAPNTPAMDAPNPFAPPPGPAVVPVPQVVPGAPGAPGMVPGGAPGANVPGQLPPAMPQNPAPANPPGAPGQLPPAMAPGGGGPTPEGLPPGVMPPPGGPMGSLPFPPPGLQQAGFRRPSSSR